MSVVSTTTTGEGDAPAKERCSEGSEPSDNEAQDAHPSENYSHGRAAGRSLFSSPVGKTALGQSPQVCDAVRLGR